MGEEAETHPGCFSALLSHTGTYKTGRQVAGGGLGPFQSLCWDHSGDGGKGAWSQRGEAGKRLGGGHSCRLSPQAAPLLPTPLPSRGSAHRRPHSPDTLLGPTHGGRAVGGAGVGDMDSQPSRSLPPSGAALLHRSPTRSTKPGIQMVLEKCEFPRLLSTMTRRPSNPHFTPGGSLTN